MPTQFDAAHWREKAARAISLAEQADDPLSADILAQLAEDYERLAVSIDRSKAAESAALRRKKA
jgi:hypothetical protein